MSKHDNPRRMWINQPSTAQPLHHLHGTNVLAYQEDETTYEIFFLSGDIISQQASYLSLSEGWNAPPVKPSPFTVLLLYPEYMSVNYGQETYLAHVEARDVLHAIQVAQTQACGASSSCQDSEDFYPLLVIDGHHNCRMNGG